MKAKVVVPFYDIENPGDIYYAGDVFEGTEKRVAELAAKGHVEKPKAAPRRRTAKKKE